MSIMNLKLCGQQTIGFLFYFTARNKVGLSFIKILNEAFLKNTKVNLKWYSINERVRDQTDILQQRSRIWNAIRIKLIQVTVYQLVKVIAIEPKPILLGWINVHIL